MKIKEKKNKKMSLKEVDWGSVIKLGGYYWMVVDYLVDSRIMIISLDDGSYDLVDGNEEVEVVEKIKLVIG